MSSLISDISQTWLYYGFEIVYFLTIVGIIIVILSENRNPVKTLAWVTVLLLFPGLGLVLYVFFGRSIKNTRMISRRNRRRLRRHNEPQRRIKASRLGLSVDSQRLIRLTRTLSGSPVFTGNKVKIYTRGDEKMSDLFDDIARARSFVNLQYYIIDNDRVGRRLGELLMAKAAEGVTVRLIYDNVGSFDIASSFFRRLRRGGVEAHPFFKVVFPPFGTRINWRNHRKICIIDGDIGYIGGMNVAERYVDGGRRFDSWRDTHIRVTGPAVSALMYAFGVDWNFMGQHLCDDMVAPPALAVDSVDCPMQLLTSGPTQQWPSIAQLFLKAIASAKERVYVQTPYFLPTEALLRALQTSALAGCDVRIMMPQTSDSAMLTYASASYITECLRSGIKIYLYTAGMMHAKTLLVDDEFVSIGSTNFDFRSFEHNFEANMQIYSREVNRRMQQIFHDDMLNCQRINLPDWKHRKFIHKAFESLTRLLSPIL